jgi:N-acetyl-anhydromuramyl-L-alanine amidase AmpD
MSNVRVLPTRGLIEPALALPNIAMIEARFYRRGPRRSRALWIVLHATHGAEHARAAEDGAREHQRLPDGAKKRSTHLWVDCDSVVQSVPFECEAYHAGPHANQYGEGIELCGRADQTREQWLDAQSIRMLSLAAHVLRWRSDMLFIPLIFRGPGDLVKRIPGVTTHAAITQAFPGDTSHGDPGPYFPLVELLEAARSLPSGGPAAKP